MNFNWTSHQTLTLFEDDGDQARLIQQSPENNEMRPLADRLRPQNLSDFVGQTHLLAHGKPLSQLLANQRVHSMILWGPPGTGKTTLANLIARNAAAQFIGLSAVLSGVKDVRAAVEKAKLGLMTGVSTILFVDEVHRFNKAQQDAFLPHVENGTLTFIGATTENPSFEVNAALLSRARVYVLKSLQSDELSTLVERAAEVLGMDISEEATTMLCQSADGDARRLLNILDVGAQLAEHSIEVEHIVAASGESLRRFDKGGDLFYEQISALHKSLRGSAPDAALYWFCRMLDGGADPRYIGRRLVRFASEDVGNADPRALELCQAAVNCYERLGSPEGELGLAQAVLYLASVPKSNSVYTAFKQAQEFVKNTPSYDVPMHIRNAPTDLMKGLGYGENYRYAHDENSSEGGYAAGENYFPEEISPPQFYYPKDSGLESKIAKRLERLKALDAAATDLEQDSQRKK